MAEQNGIIAGDSIIEGGSIITGDGSGLEIYTWTEAGYRPLVFSHDWQVALLNWGQAFALDKVERIERHNQTDEVFVLLKGSAALLTVNAGSGMQVAEMQPGQVYNVRQGAWHSLIATPDATWIIVENRDTHLHDCEYRPLSAAEQAYLHAHLPPWASRPGP